MHEFQVSVRPSGGIRVWDVRFNGERIAYEVALQEAMISQGGATPSQVLDSLSVLRDLHVSDHDSAQILYGLTKKCHIVKRFEPRSPA